MIAFAASGCGHRHIETTALAARDLTSTTSVYIAVPSDGRFGTKTYTGSGLTAAHLIAEAFATRLGRVEFAAGAQPPGAALAESRARGVTYLVLPAILRWEDRSSRWSGMADVVEVRLSVIDTGSGEAADIAVIRRRGDPERVGARPEDLLPAALQAYVARLLRAPDERLQAKRAPQ